MQLQTRVRAGRWLLALLAVVTLTGYAAPHPQIVQKIDENQLATLQGSVHPLAQAKFDQGAAPDALPLKQMLLLLKRDAASEQALNTAVAGQHDPSSANYHKWLTPAQFQKQYGASAADVSTLTSWLGGKGFTGIKLSAGGTVVEFSGTAGTVSSAFHTEIHQYKVNGELHYANASNPQVPAALLPAIKGLVSLNNFPHKAMHEDVGLMHYSRQNKQWDLVSKSTGQTTGTGQATGTGKASGVQPQLTFTDPSSGTTYYAVTPSDFSKIYNVQPLWDAGIDGTGQSIAIVGRSGFNTSDVDQFRAAFGLPATKLNTIVVNEMPDINTSASETLLDLQWSGAVAKNATIDYVVASSTDSTDGIELASLYAVDNNVAPVLSVSYGLCEAALGTTGNAFYNEIWRQAASEGMTVLVASGDYSSAGCDTGYYYADYGLQVSGIASTPYNIAVGGTDFNDFGGPNGAVHTTYWNSTNDSITRASALSYIPEMVWNDSCANSQIYGYFNYGDPEAFCNSDTANNDSLVKITGGSGGLSSCTVLGPTGDLTDCAGGYDKPSWQNVAGVPDDAKRDMPDVSLFAADGVARSFYIYCRADYTDEGYCNYNNTDDLEYLASGGTSFATPAFAGIMALVNQKAGLRQGNANYVLYSLARGQFGSTASPVNSELSACSSDNGVNSDSACIFHDVISGGNAVPCAAGTLNCNLDNSNDVLGILAGYSAQTGFDLATGLGSVNTYNLVTGWAQSAAPSATATTLKLTPVTGTYGDTLNFTVNVAPTSGSGAPTGTIVLIANQQTVASATLSNGSASGSVNSLVAGSYQVTANYAPDGSYANSSSNGVAVTLGQAASTSALALYEVNPITGATTQTASIHYGATVQAAATVSGLTGLATPTGSVQFTSSGTDGQTGALSSGAVSVTLAQLATGNSETITVNYQGDTNYKSSSSAAAKLTVVPAISYGRLSTSSNYLVGTGSLTLNAVVYAYSTGTRPSGSIDLLLNGKKYSTMTGTQETDSLSGGAALAAQFTVASSDLQSGANSFSFSYAGDSNYNAVSGGTLTVGYGTTAPTSALTLTASPQNATTQQSITLTAAVTAGTIPATGGAVTFYDNGVSLGQSEVVRTPINSSYTAGTATLKLRLAAGTHAITAAYSGAGAIPAAQSSQAVSLIVSGTQASSITLAVVDNPAHYLHYDFTATITGYGNTAPSGNVALNETSTVSTLGTATLDSTTAQLIYGNTRSFDMSSAVLYVAVADMNNDGIPDVIMRIRGDNNDQIDVFLGKGDGGFTLAGSYPVGLATTGRLITIADINGDGVLDVATADQQIQTLSILLGNGDGTLQPASTLSTGPLYPRYVLAVDINKDGVPDLLVAGGSPSSTQVYFGNGDGSFQTPVTSAMDKLLSSAGFGDLNHDGNIDVVYISYLESPLTLHVALGAADGTFTKADTTYPLNAQSRTNSDVDLADVDGDGNLDAIYSDLYAGNVLIGKGDGKGGFAAPAVYPAGVSGSYAAGARAVDIHGNGKPEIAVNDFYNGTLNILPNKGDGTFGAATGFYDEPAYTSELYFADFNGDGIPDLMTSGQQYQISTSYLLLGGTQASVKIRDIAANGLSTVTQQGYASFAGDTNYGSSNSNSVGFYGSGNKATPKILWTPTASVWALNTQLGTGILDATTTGSVPGSYAYTAQVSGQAAVPVTAASLLTAKGSYLLTVTFTPSDTNSYTTATAQQSLSIVDPDFAVTASNGSTPLALQSSGTAQTTLSLVPDYGFNGTVTLSCASPNTGIDCALSSTTLTPGGSATLTVGTTASSTTASTSQQGRGTATVLGWSGAFLAALLLPLLRRKRPYMMLPVLLLAALLLQTGCGGAGAPKSTELTLSSSNTHIASGGSIALTANLSAGSQAVGNVDFYDGTTLLGSGSLSRGVASLNVNSLAVGVHTLTAKFNGTSHLQSSTSNQVTQTVTGSATVNVTSSFGTVQHTTSIPVNLQ